MVQTIETPTAEKQVQIAATPEKVWAIVSDPTRTPEWSPVCRRAEWIEPGARFRGHNRLNGARWSRECVITTSDPSRTFAFSTLFKGAESTRWRYQLDGAGGTTTLTEAYEIVAMPRWVRALRAVPGFGAKSDRDTQWNISTSLERIKALAER
ncbi:MAG: SRPBCC family protein [Actinobacteria bacterium]|nr:SRPBCC family protein [Actinomycetota bacterium]